MDGEARHQLAGGPAGAAGCYLTAGCRWSCWHEALSHVHFWAPAAAAAGCCRCGWLLPLRLAAAAAAAGCWLLPAGFAAHGMSLLPLAFLPTLQVCEEQGCFGEHTSRLLMHACQARLVWAQGSMLHTSHSMPAASPHSLMMIRRGRRPLQSQRPSEEARRGAARLAGQWKPLHRDPGGRCVAWRCMRWYGMARHGAV